MQTAISTKRNIALPQSRTGLVACPGLRTRPGPYSSRAPRGRRKSVGALVTVDAVQAFPHFPLELPTTVDFAFFSAL